MPMPIGVLVTYVNSVMAVAEKPRSSLRKSLRSPEPGAANIAIRNAEAASSTSLLRLRAASSSPAAASAVPAARGSARRRQSQQNPPRSAGSRAGAVPPRQRPPDPPAAPRTRSRQAEACRSAAGSTAKAIPEPSAAHSTSTDTAHARDRAGISSTARITMRIPRAVDSPRATSCVAPRNHSPGAAAPRAVTQQLATPAATSRRLRPWRSASAAVTSAISTPARTTAISTPCAVLPWPNSSAAKVRVAVSTCAQVAVHHLDRAQQAQHGGGSGVEAVRRGPPVGVVGLAPPQRPLHRIVEQRRPHRHREPVRDRLGELRAPGSCAGQRQTALVVAERPRLPPRSGRRPSLTRRRCRCAARCSASRACSSSAALPRRTVRITVIERPLS